MAGEAGGEGLEMVPERDFWSRSILHSMVPRPIAGHFFQVKERFGMDVANLVLYAYREWGEDVAVALARKILSFGSFGELIQFLEERARMLPEEGRGAVNSLLFSYLYSHHFSKVLEERERACEPARKLAAEVFHTLASVGLFYTPHCVVQVAEVEAGCRKRVSKRCLKTYEAYTRLKERAGTAGTA